MNDIAAPPYTIGANLLWFALIYAVAIVVTTLVAEILRELRVTLPDAGVSVGVFAGTAAIAGNRFAERREWTRRDHNLLSAGYAVVAVLVSLAFTALLALMNPADFSTLVDLSQWGIIAGILFIVVPLVLYGVSRLILMFVARRHHHDAERGSNTK